MSFGCEFPRRVVQSKMGSLEPDLISDFPGVEAPGCSGGHKFSDRVMGSKSFLSGFIESGESFLKGREESLSQSRIGMGFITIE